MTKIMPFDVQSTGKLRKRFSVRLNPSGSSNSVRTVSPFGDQLSRQLEAQLKAQGLSLDAPLPSKNIGRSHSLSSAPHSPHGSHLLARAAVSASVRRADSLGHGKNLRPEGHSAPSCHPKSTTCSPEGKKADLNRNSSTSSSESQISSHSNASRNSSPFYHLPSGPSSVGEVDGEHENGQCSEFVKAKPNSSRSPLANKTNPAQSRVAPVTHTTGLRAPITCRPSTPRPASSPPSPSSAPSINSRASLKGPMRILRSLSLNLHSGTRKNKSDVPPAPPAPLLPGRTKLVKLRRPGPQEATSMTVVRSSPKKPLLRRESLYESLEGLPPPPPSVIAERSDKKSHPPNTSQGQGRSTQKATQPESRKVKFNPTTLTMHKQSKVSLTGSETNNLTIPTALVRPTSHRVSCFKSASIQRSHSLNASLDPIPEESRMKIGLVSRASITA